MLFDATGEGGLGFCGSELPDLLSPSYHGPLVVALDSSILIDLQQHGSAVLGGEEDVEEPKYAKQLASLGWLIDIWLIRDIRFIVTPRSYTDAKKVTERFTSRRTPTVQALAESLAFQMGDWQVPAPSEWRDLQTERKVHGLPNNADRDLVEEALAVGAHVFLTRDDGLVANVSIPDGKLRVCMPADLEEQLGRANVGHFAGGLCREPGCPYPEFPPAPDMGKWAGLLSIFD